MFNLSLQLNKMSFNTRQMRPSDLRFTQDTIKAEFENGENVNNKIRELCGLDSYTLALRLQSFQPLEVAKCRNDGQWYCNNNRRLYMFRALEFAGKLHSVKVSHVLELLMLACFPGLVHLF